MGKENELKFCGVAKVKFKHGSGVKVFMFNVVIVREDTEQFYGNGYHLALKVGNGMWESFDIRYDKRFYDMDVVDYIKHFLKLYIWNEEDGMELLKCEIEKVEDGD